MDALYIVQLVFWIALLVVVIVLFIKNMREDRKYKKKMAELDKQREDGANEKSIISDGYTNIPSYIKEGIDQYRIIKAQTAYNGEKYFVEAFYQNTQTWSTLGPYNTYERAMNAKLFFEQSQIDGIANTIVTKEVVE